MGIVVGGSIFVLSLLGLRVSALWNDCADGGSSPLVDE
jgi:hypothetical protein